MYPSTDGLDLSAVRGAEGQKCPGRQGLRLAGLRQEAKRP